MRTVRARRAVVAVMVVGLVLGAVPAASAKIDVDRIVYNPTGKDTGKNGHLVKELVLLRNTGDEVRRLGGWRLYDRGGRRYTFPKGFTLAPGAVVRVRTGKGIDDNHDLFMGQQWYVWNNNGDRATLRNAKGERKGRCTYTGGGKLIEC